MPNKQTHPAAPLGRVKKVLTHTKVRFVLVGIGNTLIDIVLFNIFTQVFKLEIIPASLISTTVAMLASYALNKSAVFKDGKPHSAGQIILFLVVTLTGIWLIQTVVMAQVFAFLQTEFVTHNHPLLVWFLQNVAKAAGVVIGAVWNYLGYSRLVFKDKP